MRLLKPYPAGYSVNPNGAYGMRRHPITGRVSKHRGIDIAGVFPVTSAGDGVVVHVGYNGNKRTGGGHVVIIDHGEVHSVYYHGKHAPSFKVGHRIKAGEFVYTSGTTGASTGNHVHFEVRKRKAWGTDVDPIPYFGGTITQTVLKVSGRLDKDTWREWQKVLKDKGFYKGRIDGSPGPMTYGAIQAWAGVPITGRLDLPTRKAVQEKLGVRADGSWGRVTISALQRVLNGGGL